MSLINKSSKISKPIEKASKSVLGTSFYGGYIYSSANEISKICGDPYKIYDEKVTYKWELEIGDIVFTIYDYREASSPNMSTKVYYHLGTLTEEDTEKVLKVFDEYGFETTTLDKLMGKHK